MMDPSVQQGGVEHVIQHHPSQHADIGNVDPHMGVLSMSNNVHNHMLAQQVSPVLGNYMHSPHSLGMPPSSSVHIVPNPVSQVSLSGSPYVHPGLMQEQTEKYGPLLFHKDDQGLYTCFFTGCGKKLKANFSRHVAKHEMDNDKMDPTLATQIQASSASKNLGTTKICSHPTHQDWWGTSAEQPVTEFYKRCSKCKKCYIRLQQESKRLRIESLNNSPAPVNFGQPFPTDMFGHVNSIQMIDQHHMKRDSLDDEQGPAKRMRIEDSPQLIAHLDALTDKHFKEMAELTARHSANSRKLIAENTTIRMTADIRNTKQKEELEMKLRTEWDQFRLNCLREREDLYQAQLLALQRELNGASVPSRPCKLCSNRMYSTFLYQCNLCNEEACIRCQAVMVCGICGTKSCENCTIKHNWLIWCNRCHKTFCSNHRGISDEICPGCERKDMMMSHHLPNHHLQLDHQSHLHPHHHHHSHDLDLHHDYGHHSNHHPSQEELMGQQLKFEGLDHEDDHPHPHSHQYSSHDPHLDPHMHPGHHLDHLPHEHLPHDHHHHLQHHQYSGHEHLQHDHMPHEHLHDHHLQHHDHSDHYQEQYNIQHMPSDLEHQSYEQNYQEHHEYQDQDHGHEQSNGHEQDLDESEQGYQAQNHHHHHHYDHQQNGSLQEQEQNELQEDQRELDQQGLVDDQEGIIGGEQSQDEQEEQSPHDDQQNNNEPYQYGQEPEPEPEPSEAVLQSQPQPPPNDPDEPLSKFDELEPNTQQPIQ